MPTISTDEIIKLLHSEKLSLPEEFYSRAEKMDLAWRDPSEHEYHEFLFDSIRRIDNLKPRDSEQNKNAFDAGWAENYDEVNEKGLSEDVLKPKYFRGSRFLRYNNKLICSDNHQLEHDLFVLVRMIFFTKYLSKASSVYELGCGSCGNLLMMSRMYPEIHLHGLDWAKPSVKIADLMAAKYGAKVKGRLFDMLNPDDGYRFDDESVVVTIHAMEQLGNKYGFLVSYLMKQKPQLVVHYEPVLEYYDENNMLDYLALRYSQKRDYLDGYYTYLKKLESEGKVEILESFRPYIGGVYHEQSLIIWRPR